MNLQFCSRENQLLQSTQNDPTLQLLAQYTHQGWPESCKDCPHELLGYGMYRECISLENGLLFKDNRLIIPQSECEDTLKLLHYRHYGVNHTTDRARETVLWPGINDDIQRKVSQCQVCQKNSSSLQQETMQSHEVAKALWTKVGVDLFEYNKQQYLLVVDYYSKFPYTCRLHSPDTSTIINKLKEIFAENGIPETVITDGRPQFRSEFKQFAKN